MIPPRVWDRQRTGIAGSNPAGGKDVCIVSVLFLGRSLCFGPITRRGESYRLWCVIMCGLETSLMGRPWPALGRCATEEDIMPKWWRSHHLQQMGVVSLGFTTWKHDVSYSILFHNQHYKLPELISTASLQNICWFHLVL